MKITKSKQLKPLYEGKSRITRHGTGALISENRSTGADNRISAHSVLLSREELLEALRVTECNCDLSCEASNQLPEKLSWWRAFWSV